MTVGPSCDPLAPRRPAAPAQLDRGFHVGVQADHGVVRLRLTGELDVLTGPWLTAALAPLLGRRAEPVAPASARTVVFDLTALTFLDSTGLSALSAGLTAFGRAGWQVYLTHPRRHHHVLFDLALAAGWLPDDLEYVRGETRPISVPPRPEHRAAVPRVRKHHAI